MFCQQIITSWDAQQWSNLTGWHTLVHHQGFGDSLHEITELIILFSLFNGVLP